MTRVLVPTLDVTPPRATLTTSLSGSDNDLTFRAQRGGSWGNSIRVRYVDPAANNQALSVDVDGFDITVNLATGPAGAITSTANEVAAKIVSDSFASRLVEVEVASSNTGAGIVTALSFTALSGGAYGVTSPALTNGDATNDHYLTGNDGFVELEVVSTDAGAQTVTVHYAALADVPGTPEVIPVAAGATMILGPFSPGLFNQNGDGDVYFDPSVSSTLDFRARRVVRAT